MLRRALFDYISSFRWRNIKKAYKYNTSVFFIMLPFYIYQITNALIKDTEASICLLPWLFIFMFGTMGLELVPLRLPKLMFLCPMNRKERKQYISIMYWLKIVIPSILEVLVGMIGVMCGIWDSYVAIICVFLIFSGMIYLANEPTKGKRTVVKKSVLVILGMLIVISVLIYVAFCVDKMKQGIYGRPYILLAALVSIAILDIVCLRMLPNLIEESSNYEERFDIIKSQKKAV